MVEFGNKDLTLPINLMNGTLSPFKSLWYLIPIMTQETFGNEGALTASSGFVSGGAAAV